MNAKQRTRCMTSCSWLFPQLLILTTAALLHKAVTDRLRHSLPHTAAPNTIGMSSLIVMWSKPKQSDHSSWNHLWFQRAPHPHLPDASKVMMMSCFCSVCDHSMDTPFHCAAKQCHHSMSDLASQARWICRVVSWQLPRDRLAI